MRPRPRGRVSALLLACVLASGAASAPALAGPTAGASADRRGHGFPFIPGALVISRSVYANDPSIIAPGTVLPPGCQSKCGAATNDGTYPFVWNNDLVDPSFGITSPIFLDQVLPSSGFRINSLAIPTGPGGGLVTSFPSKSELGLNLSTDGRSLTFMGYVAPVNAIDVSNSNTPGVIDPTNPVSSAYYRAVAQLDRAGRVHFTETNAYSANNGRAAILNSQVNVLYTAGNAGNGANPQPKGVILGAGAQIMTPSLAPEAAQMPGDPTPVASFSVTQLGYPADKVGKDDNFRGMTIFDHVLYYTKGSGGNGVNTVYFVDTTGHACPSGTGLPDPNAPLPTSPLAYDPSVLAKQGLQPSNMCVLKGFTTTLAKNTSTSFPFGMWFANDHTLYLADEGNGTHTYSPATGTYTAAAAQTTAGLQKWVLESGSWKLAYTLRGGLNLGQPYSVPGYPTGNNPATGLPWAPATDGLRNITGRVNRGGRTATIWGVTSTVSGNGDQGADPNKVVAVTDDLAATTPPPAETFRTIRAAGFAEVLRGVSFAPGTSADANVL